MTTPTYTVTLLNLTPDATAIAPTGTKLERRGMTTAELAALLRGLGGIDPVANATVEPEIRVQAKGQSWLIQAGHKHLVLYDALNRDQPGQRMAVEQVLAELDGTASAARAAPHLAELLARGGPRSALPADAVKSEPASNPARVAALTALVLVLATALALVERPWARPAGRSGFRPLARTEAAALRSAMAGVYLVGTEPGQHGIVLSSTPEVRLVELRATDAPRIVDATAEPGRIGGRLCLATNQPGGLIIIIATDTLVYGTETYKRVR